MTLYGVDASVAEYIERAKNIVVTNGSLVNVSNDTDLTIKVLSMIIEVAKMIQIGEGRLR